MTPIIRICPDCESSSEVSRREFLRSAGAAALVVGAAPLVARGADAIARRQHARNRDQAALRIAQRRAAQGDLLRLGLHRDTATSAACCGRASRTTGTSPSRRSAAISTPTTSRR